MGYNPEKMVKDHLSSASDMKWRKIVGGFEVRMYQKQPNAMLSDNEITVRFDVPYEEFRILIREYFRVDTGHDVRGGTVFVKIIDRPGVWIMVLDSDLNVYAIINHGINAFKPIGFISKYAHHCTPDITTQIKYMEGMLWCDRCGNIEDDYESH